LFSGHLVCLETFIFDWPWLLGIWHYEWTFWFENTGWGTNSQM